MSYCAAIQLVVTSCCCVVNSLSLHSSPSQRLLPCFISVPNQMGICSARKWCWNCRWSSETKKNDKTANKNCCYYYCESLEREMFHRGDVILVTPQISFRGKGRTIYSKEGIVTDVGSNYITIGTGSSYPPGLIEMR